MGDTVSVRGLLFKNTSTPTMVGEKVVDRSMASGTSDEKQPIATSHGAGFPTSAVRFSSSGLPEGEPEPKEMVRRFLCAMEMRLRAWLRTRTPALSRRALANTLQGRLKLNPPCRARLAERLHDF